MKLGIFFENLAAAFPEGVSSECLLKEAAEAGFSYLETDIENLKKQNKEFFEEAKKRSIGFSVYCFTNEKCILRDGTKAEDNLPFLAMHNIKNMMMVCRPEKCSTMSRETVFSDICSGLNSLCAAARKYGIKILVEDFDSKSIPCGSCDDMLKLRKYVPDISFTLDTGNFLFFGEDVLKCYEKLRDNIGHVHLKDRVSSGDLTVPVTGRGSLPLPEILQKLKNDGYNGGISIEMFGAECSRETLREALNFLLKNTQ